jgi:hypothetical protein
VVIGATVVVVVSAIAAVGMLRPIAATTAIAAIPLVVKRFMCAPFKGSSTTVRRQFVERL